MTTRADIERWYAEHPPVTDANQRAVQLAECAQRFGPQLRAMLKDELTPEQLAQPITITHDETGAAFVLTPAVADLPEPWKCFVFTSPDQPLRVRVMYGRDVFIDSAPTSPSARVPVCHYQGHTFAAEAFDAETLDDVLTMELEQEPFPW